MRCFSYTVIMVKNIRQATMRWHRSNPPIVANLIQQKRKQREKLKIKCYFTSETWYTFTLNECTQNECYFHKGC